MLGAVEAGSVEFDILESTRSLAPMAQSEVDWTTIPGLTRKPSPDPGDLATAGITLPSAHGTRSYRVVVLEREDYLSDVGHTKRTVYVDAVLL